MWFGYQITAGELSMSAIISIAIEGSVKHIKLICAAALLSVSSFSSDAAIVSNASCSTCDVVTDAVVVVEVRQDN